LHIFLAIAMLVVPLRLVLRALSDDFYVALIVIVVLSICVLGIFCRELCSMSVKFLSR